MVSYKVKRYGQLSSSTKLGTQQVKTMNVFFDGKVLIEVKSVNVDQYSSILNSRNGSGICSVTRIIRGLTPTQN